MGKFTNIAVVLGFLAVRWFETVVVFDDRLPRYQPIVGD